MSARSENNGLSNRFRVCVTYTGAAIRFGLCLAITGVLPTVVNAQQDSGRSETAAMAPLRHGPDIQHLLKSTYSMEVERRHSRLLITRRNVRRLAVTDSGVCNYVQYSPTELAIVGLQPGTTDLTIWFESETIPTIYDISVVRDENLQEQRQSDLARLEQRLAELFPHSNLYVVPAGSQVLVNGQACNPRETTQRVVLQGPPAYGHQFQNQSPLAPQRNRLISIPRNVGGVGRRAGRGQFGSLPIQAPTTIPQLKPVPPQHLLNLPRPMPQHPAAAQQSAYREQRR